jgi:uncharacterized UBP type Zn finger protein
MSFRGKRFTCQTNQQSTCHGFPFLLFQICDIENLVNLSKNETKLVEFTLEKKSQCFCCKTNQQNLLQGKKTLANNTH